MERKWVDSFVSTGKIVYDPNRGDMKKRTKWWCVVDVDREITRYFRYWVKRELWIDLHKPAWDAHISVIRGEQPSPAHLHLWKKYHGQKVPFEYSLHVKQPLESDKDHFWYVSVNCPFLDNLRTELGLKTGWTHHLTIGRTYS